MLEASTQSCWSWWLIFSSITAWGRILHHTWVLEIFRFHCASLLLSKWEVLSEKFNLPFDACCMSNPQIMWIWYKLSLYWDIWTFTDLKATTSVTNTAINIYIRQTAKGNRAQMFEVSYDLFFSYDFFKVFTLTIIHFSISNSCL